MNWYGAIGSGSETAAGLRANDADSRTGDAVTYDAVVLPDGKAFITGGQSYAKPFTDTNAILTPELWEPATTKFAQTASNTTPRTYHSVALLMPNSKIFTDGGGLCGTCKATHFDAESYSPPYLFLSDGKARAPRPVISSLSSTTVKVGGSVTITMQSTVPNFCLIRMGAATHTANTDQRRIPLTLTAGKG
jgi:galactose oxidase